MRQHFDLAGPHVRVDRALGTRAHEALDLEDILGADALRLGEDFRPVGVENDLQQALPITQIDEDYAAMVTPPVNPAANLDYLADERFVDLSAVVSTHRKNPGETLKKGGGMVRPGGLLIKPQAAL